MISARTDAKRREVAERLGTGLFDVFEPLAGGGNHPDILAYLAQGDREEILSRGRRWRLEPGAEVFRQGEEHQGVFLIESGFVRIYYTSPAGREITLAYWRPGNFVGGPDIFGGTIHMWSGMAVEDTEVIAFSGTDLRALMMKFPGLGVGFVEALAFKGECFSSLVQILGTRSVSERLSQLLLSLCNRYGRQEESGAIVISIQFTHEDLAHMVGASRQWVTTALNRLQKQDILRIRKRQISVLRPESLARTELSDPSPL